MNLTDEQIDALWITRPSIHDGQLAPQLRDFARRAIAAAMEQQQAKASVPEDEILAYEEWQRRSPENLWGPWASIGETACEAWKARAEIAAMEQAPASASELEALDAAFGRLDAAIADAMTKPPAVPTPAAVAGEAQGRLEVDALAAIAAGFARHKYRQGTSSCVAFYRGACWHQEVAASPAQVSLPQGWVAVPKEPTPEMVRAGYLHKHRDAYDPEADVYRAMLSAAPPVAPQAAKEVVATPPPISFTPGAGMRDWPEDYAHENGMYQCRCAHCKEMFIGHKRRVSCKLCAASASKASGVNLKLGDAE